LIRSGRNVKQVKAHFKYYGTPRNVDRKLLKPLREKLNVKSKNLHVAYDNKLKA